jgi:hypothetical protein
VAAARRPVRPVPQVVRPKAAVAAAVWQRQRARRKAQRPAVAARPARAQVVSGLSVILVVLAAAVEAAVSEAQEKR